jgi:D-3-phosphoglycerate dehydrogenase
MPKVLVCDPVAQDGIEMLKQASFVVEENFNLTPEELERRITEFDAVIVRGRTKITSEILSSAGNLRAVARSGVGLDNIDLETAKKKSIQIISTPAAPTTSVAELAIALMLALLRKVPLADKSMKEGRWAKSELLGSELKSKTVGVVGAAGRIGLEVARIVVQGFGAKALGYDVLDVAEKAREVGFRAVGQLPELLQEADIVSIHVPYLASTHHLIDRKAFGTMKKGAILINASRGDIVDGEAMFAALKSGNLGGAGLDVFHKEPPVDDWERKLVQLPNVVCTSHIGAQTVEAQRLESTMVAEELIRAFNAK